MTKVPKENENEEQVMILDLFCRTKDVKCMLRGAIISLSLLHLEAFLKTDKMSNCHWFSVVTTTLN